MKKLVEYRRLGLFVLITLTLTILTIVTVGRKPAAQGKTTPLSQAAAAVDSSSAPDQAALELIHSTIDRIEQLQSISTELEIDSYLFGETYKGVGKYEELLSRTEQRPSPSGQSNTAGARPARARRLSPLEWSRFRLHVKMLPIDAKVRQEHEEESVLEVVCDLKALWTYRKIEGSESLTQLHIEDLANCLSRLTEEEKASLADNAVERPCGMSGLPGLGGVSGLLRRFLVFYDFLTPPEDMALDNGRFPVWKISASLKKEHRQLMKNKLLADDPVARRTLLETVPTNLELFIGKERPFPYRIRYYSQWDEENLTPQPICSISFNPYYENVASINPQNFIYGPPPLNYDRINDRYLLELVPGIEL
ncbi:MAG: hypothetical protein Q4G68_14945 [Planctomycetia bacterium]|nr:hypothetical protein [Planctomycetia bacterium]